MVLWTLSTLTLSTQAVAQARDDRGLKIVEAAIDALGGQAYLDLRDYRAEGRAFSFDRFEDLSGMAPMITYEHYPDKFRQEIGKKRDVIYVMNGDHAWDANFKGVAEMPDAERERIQLSRQLSIDTILRFRTKEPGVEFNYLGVDFVDGRQVDKVEFADRENNAAVLSFDSSTHLPLRREWERKLPNHQREQNLELLSKYLAAKNSSVLFPYYIHRERNGQKIFESFLSEVTVGKVSAGLFERPSGKERIDVPSRNATKKGGGN